VQNIAEDAGKPARWLTLQFAAKMRVPRNRPQGVTRTDAERSTVEMLQTMFGLHQVKDTFIGDAGIRGVSSGEKKRVTISEALALRMLVGAWDEYVRSIEACTACSLVTFYPVLREGWTRRRHWSSCGHCDSLRTLSGCRR